MSGKVRHISRRVYPKTVKIINGAPAAMVSLRELRGQHVTTGKAYETNRNIKYYSTWLLLKSLSTSSKIEGWIYQKKYLLHWLQMNENTFRRHLAWLKQEELLTIDKSSFSIRMCGYAAAAEHMGIEYAGTYQVPFNPNKYEGKQTFQYLLRTEEFEFHKQRQLDAFTYKLENNPSLKQDLLYWLLDNGADYLRLQNEPAYYAEQLVILQAKFFRDGSENLAYVMSFRADLNRGVKLIKKHHKYRSMQSVTYMKRRMLDLGFAEVFNVPIPSKKRSRFYIPADADTPPGRVHNGMRDGYKYDKANKRTVWNLTTQVKRTYKTDIIPSPTEKLQKNAA